MPVSPKQTDVTQWNPFKHVNPEVVERAAAATVVGGSAKVLWSPIERAAYLVQKNMTPRQAFTEVLKKPYYALIPQMRAAYPSSLAFYGTTWSLMNKEDPFIITAVRCGFWSAVCEQMTCGPVSEYIYKNHHNEMQPKIPAMDQWRRNSTFFARHLYGNTGTLFATFSFEYILNQILPTPLYPLSSFLGASMGTFVVHRSGFNYLIALHVKVSTHPDKTIKWCWDQLIRSEVIRLGDIRSINRMGISGTTFSLMRIIEHYFFDKKAKKINEITIEDKANPPKESILSTSRYGLFKPEDSPNHDNREDDLGQKPRT